MNKTLGKQRIRWYGKTIIVEIVRSIGNGAFIARFPDGQMLVIFQENFI